MKPTAQTHEITASEVAEFTFCPESSRLAALGYERSAETQARLTAGREEHRRWQRREDIRSGHDYRPRYQFVFAAIFVVIAIVVLLFLR